MSSEPLTDMLGQSFSLAERGWSVIPVGPDKKPLVEWKKFQSQKPTNDEIFSWFGDGLLDKPNLGAITGKLSNFVVVDVDPRHGGSNEKFADLGTLGVKTGGGGWHYYFQYEEGLQNQAGIQPGIDLRAEGGYVVAPPSLHQSGNRYEWVGDPTTTEILPLPDFVRSWLVNKEIGEYKSSWSPDKLDGVGEGQRNETAASVAGKLLATYPTSEWETEAWRWIQMWNDRNNPPLLGSELRSVFDSIGKKELQGHQSIANIIIPSAPEFVAQEFGDTDWLIEDLVPIGGSAIVVAKRESFKTWLALYLSSCVSKGVSLWDKIPTHKNKVIYISNDDPARNFQKRLDIFHFDGNLFIYHPALPSFSIEQVNGSFNSVKKLITEERIGLVIVDILRNTHNKDSNTDKDAKLVFDKYKELRESNPSLALLFIIHPSKEQLLEKRFGKRQSEEAVGSYYWEAAVDTVISLTKTTEDDIDQVVIAITKNKQSEKKIKPFIGIRRKGEGPVEFVYEEKIPDKLKTSQAKDYILQILVEKSYLRQEIIDLVVLAGICGARLVEDALKELTTESEIVHTKSKPHVYSLAQDGPSEDSANRNGIYPLRNAESKVDQPELLPKEVNE